MNKPILSKDRLLLLKPEERRLYWLNESGLGGDVLDENCDNSSPVAWFDNSFDDHVSEKVYNFLKEEGLVTLNELDTVQKSGMDWTWPLCKLPFIGWFFKALFAILGAGLMGLNTLLIFQKLKRLMRRLVYRTEYGKEKRWKIIPEIFRKHETPPCYDQLERNMERTVYTQGDIILHGVGYPVNVVEDVKGGTNK